MNKKKRALALGLATTQLAALSAVVSPLMAFAAEPTETKITVSEVEYTVKTPAADDCKGYTVSAAANDDSSQITITVAVTNGYAPDADKTVPTTNIDGVTFEAANDEDNNFTGWSASFVPSSEVTDKTYDFSAENALAVTVLRVITPKIKLPEDTTGVTLADTLEKDDTDHSSAVSEAEKIEFSVESGVDGVTLTKDTDYTVKCEWQNGSDGAAGKVLATLELTDDAKAKYTLSSEDPITVDVPVTYKQEEQTKALTFTASDVTFEGKLDAEPTANEIKDKLELTFTAEGGSVTLGKDDYTVEVKKLDEAVDGKNYSVTVSLTNTDYTLSDEAKTVNFKVTATVKSEVEVTVTNSITAANGGNLSDQVTVLLEKVVTADDGKETKTEVTSGSKVKEDDMLILTVKVKDGFKFADDGALKVTLGSDEQSAQADGTYKLTAGTDPIAITVSGTLAEDKTPYKITLPESTDQYTVSVKYTADDGSEKTELPSDGLPAGTKITITLTAKDGFKLVSAKLGDEEAVNTADNGSTIELTYTVAKPESSDTIPLSFGEVKYQTVIKPEFETIDIESAVQLSVTASNASAISDEDKTKITAAAKTALGSSVNVLDEADYKLEAGAADTENNKVTVTFTLVNKTDYVLDENASITVDIPVKFAEEYDITAASENENVTVALTDTEDNVLTKAYVGAKVKIKVTANANYTLKSAKLGTTDILVDGLEYTILESDVKETDGSKAINLEITAETVPTVTVSTTVSDVTLTKTTKFSEALDADDKTTILTAVKAALKFTQDADSADLTLTENTDYTVGDPTFEKGNAAVKVKVSPAGTSYDVKETEITVNVIFAKTALTIPTEKAANTESAPASIPAGSDDTTIKELILAQIDNLPEDLTICDITPTGTDSIGNAMAASDTAVKATVTFKINDANKADYEFKDGDTVKDTVEVEVWFKISAPAKAITPSLTVKEGSETVYVNEAPTAENIKAALGADGIELTFTGEDPENAPQLTENSDYKLDYKYEDGTFTVAFELLNKVDYKLSGTVAPVTVAVKQIVPSIGSVSVAKQSFTTETSAAEAKTTIENAVKEAVAAVWKDIPDSAYTVTMSGSVDTSAATAETKNINVSVNLTGIYVHNDAGDTTATVQVSYDVTEAVAPAKKYDITVTASENGTVTPSAATAAENDEVILTVTPDKGYKLGTLTVKDANGTEIDVSADYKFTMPAKAVTVTATFVEEGTAAETDYKVTTAKSTGGTVTADKTTAKKGDTVTLTLTPASGYTLNKLTVTAKDGNLVPVANNKFTMPESDVTVTATFKRKSSSGSSSGGSGYSRPSGGSSSSLGISSGMTNSDVSTAIGSTASGGTVKVDGNIYIFSDVVKEAVNKKVDLEVKIDDTFTWNIEPDKLTDTESALRLSVETKTIDTAQTDKIEKSAGAYDKADISFTTLANNFGTGATLTVRTSERPTTALPRFANLYKTKSDGTLEFVAAAPISADGSAVLPIGTAGTYTIVTSTETKKPGDINNDCKVDLTDLIAALNKYANNTALTKADDFKMDHDKNGTCTLSDIVVMLEDFANGKL